MPAISTSAKPSVQVAKSLPVVAVLSLGLLAGCNGDPAPTPEPAGNTDSQTADPKPTGVTDSGAAAQSIVRTDPDGRKWIDDIPYDVWFEDPLAVVADETAVTRAAETQPDVESDSTRPNSTSSETVQPEAEQTGSRDWSVLISIVVLDDEVKQIRNALAEYLQSVGRFNRNLEDVRRSGAVLAALGEVAARHTAQTSWSGNSRFVRDLGAKIEEQAQEPGRDAFERARLPFQQFSDLLSAESPMGLEEPNPQAEFAERADRSSLMQRMDQAFKWLRQNKATETDFKADPDETIHEAAVLATLSAVVATEGYTSADEPEYRTHVEGLIAECLELSAAVEAENFAKFTGALSRVEKRCNACHREYRFADEL